MESQEVQAQQPKRRFAKNKLISALAIIVLVLAAGTIGFFLGEKSQKDEVKALLGGQTQATSENSKPQDSTVVILGQNVTVGGDSQASQTAIKTFLDSVTKDKLMVASFDDLLVVYNLSVSYQDKDLQETANAVIKQRIKSFTAAQQQQIKEIQAASNTTN